jgi:hypothetical protein
MSPLYDELMCSLSDVCDDVFAGSPIPEQEPRAETEEDQPHSLLHLHDFLSQVCLKFS